SARIWPIQAFIHDYKGMAILFTAMTIYALSAIGWVFVLRMLPLGKAYMFMSCSFLLMPLIAHLVFGEPLTIKTIFGSMLIVIGILVSVAL
ncbi:MAG: EamA family transporter, partial [Rickettsiales bacterium]